MLPETSSSVRLVITAAAENHSSNSLLTYSKGKDPTAWTVTSMQSVLSHTGVYRNMYTNTQICALLQKEFSIYFSKNCGD